MEVPAWCCSDALLGVRSIPPGAQHYLLVERGTVRGEIYTPGDSALFTRRGGGGALLGVRGGR